MRAFSTANQTMWILEAAELYGGVGASMLIGEQAPVRDSNQPVPDTG